MQRAVLPEAALGADGYLSSLTTMAEVCKVYAFVFGGEREKKVAMAGFKDKSQTCKRMKLCLKPEIRFIEDESMERGSRVRNRRSCRWSCSLELQLKSFQREGGFCTTLRWQVTGGL
ncbi:hypothetical protein ACQ4PT_063255 [Festuca glaucescens]